MGALIATIFSVIVVAISSFAITNPNINFDNRSKASRPSCLSNGSFCDYPSQCCTGYCNSGSNCSYPPATPTPIPACRTEGQSCASISCCGGQGIFCNSARICANTVTPTPAPTAIPTNTPTPAPTAIPTTACTGTCQYSDCSVMSMKTATGWCSPPQYCCGEKIIVPNCNIGDKSCAIDNSGVWVCKADRSGYTLVSCSAGKKCDSGSSTCVALPTSIPTPTATPTNTPTPIICKSGACQGEGSIKCTGGNQYRCDGQCWNLTKSCPNGCQGTACAPAPTSTPTPTPTTACTGTCQYSDCSVMSMKTATGKCPPPQYCCGEKIIDPECNIGDKLCNADDSGVWVCTSDRSGYTLVSCSAGKKCDPSSSTCVVLPTSTPQPNCLPIYSRYEEGKCCPGLVKATTPYGYYCGEMGGCSSGTKCELEGSTHIQSTCNSSTGYYENKKRCDFGCNGSVCKTGMCTPGEKTCFNSIILQTCAADGSGWTKQSCVSCFDNVCSQGLKEIGEKCNSNNGCASGYCFSTFEYYQGSPNQLGIPSNLSLSSIQNECHRDPPEAWREIQNAENMGTAIGAGVVIAAVAVPVVIVPAVSAGVEAVTMTISLTAAGGLSSLPRAAYVALTSNPKLMEVLQAYDLLDDALTVTKCVTTGDPNSCIMASNFNLADEVSGVVSTITKRGDSSGSVIKALQGLKAEDFNNLSYVDKANLLTAYNSIIDWNSDSLYKYNPMTGDVLDYNDASRSIYNGWKKNPSLVEKSYDLFDDWVDGGNPFLGIKVNSQPAQGNMYLDGFDQGMSMVFREVKANLADLGISDPDVGDIALRLYDRNSYIQGYKNPGNELNPWHNGVNDALQAAVPSVPIGQYFNPNCPGNICYQNAIAVQGIAAQHNQLAVVTDIGLFDKATGGAVSSHSVVSWVRYNYDGTVTSMVSDPTLGVSMTRDKYLNEYLPSHGYSIQHLLDEIIYTPYENGIIR